MQTILGHSILDCPAFWFLDKDKENLGPPPSCYIVLVSYSNSDPFLGINQEARNTIQDLKKKYQESRKNFDNEFFKMCTFMLNMKKSCLHQISR